MKKTSISIFIVIVISFQCFTTFRLHTYIPIIFPPTSQLGLEKYRAPALWPFLTYPMYREAHYRGDEIEEYRVYAVLQDSIEVRVLPKDVNIGFFKFQWDFVPALQDNERNRIQNYISLIEEKYKRNVISLRLEAIQWVLSKNGVTQEIPEMIAEIDFVKTDSLK